MHVQESQPSLSLSLPVHKDNENQLARANAAICSFRVSQDRLLEVA